MSGRVGAPVAVRSGKASSDVTAARAVTAATAAMAAAATTVAWLCWMVVPLAAQSAPACAGHEAFSALDFWVGDWTVWVEGQQVGTNSILKVQDGCAIEEHWVDAEGGTGQSLFYFLPATSEWKQVWVTPFARLAGGVKEKAQVEAPEGAMRFQGAIEREDGTTYLDRTTLTPRPGGEVRQHIEVSTDQGASWRTTFDAVYRPTGSG